MKRFLILIATFSLLSSHCGILEPDHEFRTTRVHSYEIGSPELDTAIILEILELNNISSDSFSSVATFRDDRRVHALNFSGYGLDTLPENIYLLGEVDTLDLSNNQLKTLPDAIVSMNFRNAFDRCADPCGGPDCCITYYRVDLNLDSNYLCSLSDTITSWLENQQLYTPYTNLLSGWELTQICD